MNHVYVITDGSYSDYHIEGIFSSRARAKTAIRRGQHTGVIEKWTLNDLAPINAHIKAGWRRYDVRFTRAGIDSVEDEGAHATLARLEGTRYTGDSPKSLDSWRVNYCGPNHPRSPGIMYVGLFARSEAAAIKSAADRRSFVLANLDLATTTHTDHDVYRFNSEELT
jgi:hypothetical protein